MIHRTLLAICLTLIAIPAQAHKPSDSYLTLTARSQGVLEVQWHVALRDLAQELPLDDNDDGQLTWQEVRRHWPAITQYVHPHLQVQVQGQDCERMPVDPDGSNQALIGHSDGTYAVLNVRWQCPSAGADTWRRATVSYHLMALSDPTHRGIVRWQSQTTDGRIQPAGIVVMGQNRTQATLAWTPLPGREKSTTAAESAPQAMTLPLATALAQIPEAEEVDSPTGSQLSTLWHFIQEGVHHIAIGTDHVLFLISLLMVSVWTRQPSGPQTNTPPWRGGWRARDTVRSTLSEALKLVTAFTLGHSLTLGLATLGMVSPPSRWVESLIALSVLLAACDNLHPFLKGPRWLVVLLFGLVHGFGFASVLKDLGLDGAALTVPLLGFNIGVELGQLMLVAVFLPLAFALRRTRVYRIGVVCVGSALVGTFGLIWLIERMFNLSLMP